MCLIPVVAESVSIPVIAAGGIGSGKAMAAAFALGAEGVQIGSRFVVTPESSAHINFKNAIVDANEGATELTLKELTPVRLMKNKFYHQIQDAYSNNATDNELGAYLLKKNNNTFNIAGKLSLNEWRGEKNVEFIIDDISVNKNKKN